MSIRIAEFRRPAFRSTFAFRSAWDDFLWPLIALNKPDMFPLPIALAFLRDVYGVLAMSSALVQAGCIACGILSRTFPWVVVGDKHQLF
jgi:ABC-type glycerol-3-phosphate transport system permease component